MLFQQSSNYFRFIYNLNFVSGYCGNSAGKYPGGKFEVSWVALLAYCNRLTLNLFVNLLSKIDDSLKKFKCMLVSKIYASDWYNRWYFDEFGSFMRLS